MDTIKKRQDEATSKETLEDLEDETSATDNTDESDNTSGPSPDGAFDDSDDLKAADPI